MAELLMKQQYKTDNGAKHASSKNGFTRKCASLIKEQRSRIYILRRCAVMLIRSYIQGDD